MSDKKVINIPDNTEYTKPNEISALSKFLGKIKKTLELHVGLINDNLELPKNDINKGDIKDLDEHKKFITIKDTEDIKLNQDTVILEDSSSILLNSESVSLLVDNNSNILRNNLILIKNILEAESLRDDAEILEGTEELNSLNKNLEELNVDLKISLIDNKVLLEVQKHVELVLTAVKLNSALTNLKLSNNLSTIKVLEINDLSNNIITLIDDNDLKLNSDLELLKECNSISNLCQDALNLSNTEIPISLEDFLDKLNNEEKDYNLNSIINLKKIELISKLSSSKELIEVKDSLNLPNDIIKILDDEDLVLEIYRWDLSEIDKNALNEYQWIINDTDVVDELSTLKDNLPSPSHNNNDENQLYCLGIKYLMSLDGGSKLNSQELNELENLKNYYKLPDLLTASKIDLINNVLNKYSWGRKFTAYLAAIAGLGDSFKYFVPKGEERLLLILKNGREVDSALLKETGEVEMSSLWQSGKFKDFVTTETGSSLRIPEYLYGSDLKSEAKTALFSGVKLSRLLRLSVEETIGKIHTNGVTGRTRLELIDSTLKGLILARNKYELLTSSEKHRLPGTSRNLTLLKLNETASALTGGLNLGINKVLSRLSNLSDIPEPFNVPEFDKETLKSKLRSYWLVNNKNKKGLVTFSLDYNNYNVSDTNLKGLAITFKELLNIQDNQLYQDAGDLETFYTKLKDSDKIKTSNSFIGNIGGLKVMTLDSNHIWEVIIEPYLGPDNGYITFLPEFSEINLINKNEHNYETRWTNWLPIISYELNSKKLVSKTAGLFDGEISYPSSLEFTNELRISLVDDLYKSWKMYFEKVMKLMVCLSRPRTSKEKIPSGLEFSWESKWETKTEVVGYTNYHDPIEREYQEKSRSDNKYISSYVEGIMNPAPYKNVTFRCLIYSMTPLLSTIKKFDLLMVLKDLLEEFLGEIDAGAGELSLNFSVVGENPCFEDKYKNPYTEQEINQLYLTEFNERYNLINKEVDGLMGYTNNDSKEVEVLNPDEPQIAEIPDEEPEDIFKDPERENMDMGNNNEGMESDEDIEKKELELNDYIEKKLEEIDLKINDNLIIDSAIEKPTLPGANDRQLV